MFTENCELNFETDYKNQSIEIKADIELQKSTDNNYGSDIDGRRGESATFIDDWRIISAEWKLRNNWHYSSGLKPKNRNKIYALINKQIETTLL